MVVLSISLCTRSGASVFSRQTSLELSKMRVESLLAQFPRLIKPDQQHTYVETDSVRYIYHPLDSYYLVLITNKLSNILQDMDTLQFLVKVLHENMGNVSDEHLIRENIFNVLVAFDEIITLGYRENVNATSLQTYLEMESHEEMVQEIIARNKMQEAREAAKLKMKQIELQKKERRSSKSQGSGYFTDMDHEEVSQVRSVPIESIPVTQQPFGSRAGRGMKLGKKQNIDSFTH